MTNNETADVATKKSNEPHNICLFCRYLLPVKTMLQFGTNELPTYICKKCLKKFIREGNQACLDERGIEY